MYFPWLVQKQEGEEQRKVVKFFQMDKCIMGWNLGGDLWVEPKKASENRGYTVWGTEEVYW